jgi:hypothetical protein
MVNEAMGEGLGTATSPRAASRRAKKLGIRLTEGNRRLFEFALTFHNVLV